MFNIKLHVFCESESLVSFSNISQGVCDEKKAFDILITSGEFVLSVFPLVSTGNLLPYSCKFELIKGELGTQNQNVIITKWTHNQYEIFFLDNKLLTDDKRNLQAEHNFSFNSKNYLCKVYSGEQSELKIEVDGNYTFNYLMTYPIYNIKFVTLGNLLYVSGIVESYEYLLVLNFENKICSKLELLSHKIENKEEEIKSMTLLHDMTKHAKVEVFKPQNGEFAKIKEYLVYINGEKIFNNELLIPFAFIENVKVGDYKLAKKYLCEKLKNKLKKEHLKNFFGNIQEIESDRYGNSNMVACIYDDMPNYKRVKYFKFDIQNGIINNIDVKNN